jgi:hypothetical protein
MASFVTDQDEAYDVVGMDILPDEALEALARLLVDLAESENSSPIGQ